MAQGFYDLIGSMFSAPDQWVSDGSYRTTSPSLPANVPTPMSVRGLNAVGDFIPGYGDVKAIGEAGQALSQGELLAAGLLGTGAAIGLVPGAGDALARPVIAAGRRVADAVPSEAIYAGRSLAEGDFGGVFDAFTPGRPAQSLSAMYARDGGSVPVGRKVYRGDTNSEERIKGGISEGNFFVTPYEDVARLYGDQISEYTLKPDARVLVEGTKEFADVTRRRRGPLLRTMRKGENLVQASTDAVNSAKAAGYDAVEFNSMRDLGISVINPSVLVRSELSNDAGDLGALVRSSSGPSDDDLYGDLIGSNPITQRGDEILNLLKSGRGNEVTDEMLDMGDNVQNARLNEYLFNNYDLPMDQASRMARAREMGLLDDAYHATGAEFQQFIPSQVGRHGAGVYTGKNASDVQTFLPKDEETRRYAEGSQVLPLRIPDDAQMASEMKWQDALPERWNYGDPKDVTDAISGYAEAADALSQSGFKGVAQPATDWDGRVIFDPRNIRSRFARFDPRLSHLRSLSAGIGATGLLGAMDRDQLQQDTRNYLAGGA